MFGAGEPFTHASGNLLSAAVCSQRQFDRLNHIDFDSNRHKISRRLDLALEEPVLILAAQFI